MATKAKKLLITTIRHEMVVVRAPHQTTVQGFCPTCGTQVEMLTFDMAVKVSGTSGFEMIRQLAANETHSIETINGHLLVCRRSLME
jgi:hypothetical protein